MHNEQHLGGRMHSSNRIRSNYYVAYRGFLYSTFFRSNGHVDTQATRILTKEHVGIHDNNNSDRANEEVRIRKSERFARWEQVSIVCSNHGAIC
jgi:hypothetical protein